MSQHWRVEGSTLALIQSYGFDIYAMIVPNFNFNFNNNGESAVLGKSNKSYYVYLIHNSHGGWIKNTLCNKKPRRTVKN